MQTGKTIKKSILPLAVILFSMVFLFHQNLHGQDGKAKKGQPDVQIDVRREFDKNGNMSRYDSSYSFSWSYDGSGIDMDSLFESLRNNFDISPFPDDDFFNRPHEQNPYFHMFPWYGQKDKETDNDSIYGYINPEDSIYFFNRPYDFFERFRRGDPFNDTLFDEFFNDPMLGHDLRDWLDSDMQDMMENHRKTMEEMQKYFEFHMPSYPLTPDSVPHNPLRQKYFTPSKPLPKGQEI